MPNGMCLSVKQQVQDKNKQFVLKLAAKYGFMGRYNPKNLTFLLLKDSN